MKLVLVLSIVVAIIGGIFAPPVSQQKEKGEEKGEEQEVSGLEDYMEYHRYLREVVNALESDPEFRKKLEKADENDIKSGKIAEELEFVSHHVRTRLDEIKRLELQRLKELTEQKQKLLENTDNEDPSHHHLDHSNPHTFEIEDLKKLIAKTTEDLAEADKKRKEEFKYYEMQKEFEKQNKLNHTNGSEREELEKKYKEMEEKHKKHEKLHEPGHKAQLEEVWEEQDQMQQEFDPKTFFMLHDLDGNGLWDQDEVKALFVKELDKMYQQGAPEDDMRERAEEMERMRETVFNEIDTNKDGFIDFKEFLAQTKSNDFKQDHGWQGLDEQKPFTDEELAEYIRQHQANQISQGYQPPPPGYHPPGMGYPQVPPGAYHPNAVPPGGYHPNAIPPGGYHPNAVPPGPQYYPPQGLPQHQPGHINDINSNHIDMQQGYHPPPQQAQYQQQGLHPEAQINYQQQQAGYQQQQQQQQQQLNYQQPPANYPPQGLAQVNQQPPQQNYQQPHGNQQPPLAQQVNQPPQQNNQQPQVNQPPQQNLQQPPEAQKSQNQQQHQDQPVPAQNPVPAGNVSPGAQQNNNINNNVV